MQFQKTINLWADGVQEAILSGDLIVQAGNWVQCGDGPKSRFAGISKGGSLYVAHYNGSGKARNERFNDLRQALRRS